jgi:hypothetical protein
LYRLEDIADARDIIYYMIIPRKTCTYLLPSVQAMKVIGCPLSRVGFSSELK